MNFNINLRPFRRAPMNVIFLCMEDLYTVGRLLAHTPVDASVACFGIPGATPSRPTVPTAPASTVIFNAAHAPLSQVSSSLSAMELTCPALPP